MPDMTITIPEPVLVGAQKFKVRYRELPSGIFGAYQDETNAPFTLTGLTAGEYEIEYIVVLEDLTECEPILDTFIVVEDFTCTTFTPTIVQIGQIYVLRITYTAGANPACGWTFQWNQGTNGAIIPYSTLPASPLNITLPANLDTSLQIIADKCNNKKVVCYEAIVPKIADPDCTPAILSNPDLQLDTQLNIFHIRATIANSNPATSNITVFFQEISVVPAGVPPNSGTYTIGGTPPAGVPLFYGGVGVMNVQPQGIFLTNSFGEFVPNCIRYRFWFTDFCGVTHMGVVSGLWTPTTQVAGQGVFVPNGC